MPLRTLNLGILAHVDAGKTTLTERLLYAAGVIDEIGSVDAGTTQTDSLALERQRGITIRSAVVSLTIDGTRINLIDTPGHPDFIAEVDRVLSVLDGAVLVISAVEGVQPQTRVLMRALRRMGVATLLFVNKIDRPGADADDVLKAIAHRLAVVAVPMGAVVSPGTRDARFTPFGPDDAHFRSVLTETLTAENDSLLARYVEHEADITYPRLREELAAQTAQALVHPAFFGSAITGAGIDALMAGLVDLLPLATGDADAPVAGRVFKVERGLAGEKVGYVRMFSGTIRARDRLLDGGPKVTAISVFDNGAWVRRGSVRANEIGKLWGIGGIKVGDPIGRPRTTAAQHHFAPPMLEAVVVPRRRGEHGALRAALTQLADQDPLIDVRHEDNGQEITVSLYGEVQKEVIQATLADEFGVEVEFRETTTICVERPTGTGEAIEILNAQANPFRATVGLRVDPAPPGTGVEFRLRVDYRAVPLYVFRNVDSFTSAMAQYVGNTLREGLYGWPVGDCVVTMTQCNYSSPDGPPATRGPLSTAADYRKLTPMVLMRALSRAGTVVCQPMAQVTVEVPARTISAVLAALTRLRAAVGTPSPQGDYFTVETVLPAARAQDLQRQLPRLTSGEGVLEASLGGYQPVHGEPPIRRRTTANPLHRDEYLTSLAHRSVT